MAPKVSVIIPMYNSQAYLPDALQSLSAQTLTDWEALCIDDASTDDTCAIVQAKAVEDTRFKLFEGRENQGPSAARNYGIDMAQGDYVAFLDSDDMFVPDALERLIHVAGDSNLDVLDFTGTPLYETERAREMRTETFDKRTDIEGVTSGADLFCQYQHLREYHCALYFHFIRRQLLEDTHLRLEEGIIHEDELFSPLLHAQASRAMFLNEPLYVRRIHEGSLICAERGIGNVADVFVVTQRLSQWIRRHAEEYPSEFLDAFALRIFEMRQIMRQDMEHCTPEELECLRDSLDAASRVEFDLTGTLESKAIAEAVDEVRKSRSFKLGNALLALPRALGGHAE